MPHVASHRHELELPPAAPASRTAAEQHDADTCLFATEPSCCTLLPLVVWILAPLCCCLCRCERQLQHMLLMVECTACLATAAGIWSCWRERTHSRDTTGAPSCTRATRLAAQHRWQPSMRPLLPQWRLAGPCCPCHAVAAAHCRPVFSYILPPPPTPPPPPCPSQKLSH